MHCEKNLAVNIIKTIIGEKDTKKVCHDLQALGMQEFLWLKPHPSRSGDIVMPPIPWVMSKEECNNFLETMTNLVLQTKYVSSFKKYVVNKKLTSMKSHDYHVLLQ
jgi:hypothetical protein